MRIALVTDAWLPHTNDVVRSLSVTVEKLTEAGQVVAVLSPLDFRTVPCPIPGDSPVTICINCSPTPCTSLSATLRVLMGTGQALGMNVGIFNPAMDADGSIARGLVSCLVAGLRQ
jgi:hypothetical protein